MTEPLGKIEKPDAERFMSKRKLYLVPLLFAGKEAPDEYVEKFNLYWEQVSENVANLESKIGKVKYIFHESLAMAGEDGLKMMEKLNPPCYRVTMDKCQGGGCIGGNRGQGTGRREYGLGEMPAYGFYEREGG
ncbi:hypothetical protein ACFLVW_00560 [Chloroflexota bacterium]